MKFLMRVPILIVCSAFLFQATHAEKLSDADRETLLENLEKLGAASDSKVDARFRLALAAYRNAISSDEAAIALYLNCMEKVNFDDLHKRPADFRDWKRKEAEKLADPGLRLAIRHQLHWLMLTLEAASSKPDRAKLAIDAQEAVDSIFRDPAKLRDQQGILSQAAVSSVFAKAYDINHVVVKDWPLSPIDLDGIYDQILLPPYRKPSTLATLRAGWTRRIQQETVKQETWSRPAPEKRDGHEEKRVGMAANMQSPESLKFLEDGLPKLQWTMEVDMFRCGDESVASVKLLALLGKYVGHPSYKEWSDQFRKLITPNPVVRGTTPSQPQAEDPVAP
jgi:hypothetical protein